MMNRLRDLQYEFNRRQSVMLEIDYKRGLEVPTIGWKISEKDIARRRREVELNNLYRDAYLGFGQTVEFRRYPTLRVPENELDILAKSLLGFPEPLGYRKANNNCILNDSWVVNLVTREKENLMMDSFLRQFVEDSKESKKALEQTLNRGEGIMVINVTEELKDLLKVYTEAEEHLKKIEADELNSLTAYMKRFIEIQDKRKKVTEKLINLTTKLSKPAQCQDCEDEEETE